MGSADLYLSEMHRRFGYLATWLPNAPIAVGDVGVLRRDGFDREASISDFGIDVAAESATKPVDLEYCTTGCVETAFNMSAEQHLLPNGPQGTVDVTFTREDAVLFVATACFPTAIIDVRALGRRALELYNAGDWKPQWAVVTEVVDSHSSTIVIAEQAGAKLKLSARLAIASSLISLADARAGLSIESARGLSTRILAAEGLRPLFRVHGVRRGILRQPGFERKARPNDKAKPIDFIQLSDSDRI